ncbi:hypothetical protein TNCV_1233631 [Trichonephila clavipes]|nr:hypothetical protein TNCV_1233631 [Trichonephila clavipes]
MQDLDDQQPSEKDIVQPEDISNVLTEKCLENVEFKKYVEEGLVLRGTEEVFGSPNNDTFMGALGLLDEFDPFICELIEQRELRPKSLIPILKTNGLLLDNGRRRSYDNAANMSGEYNGVQDLLKEKNKFANYGPCAVHSLNLVRAELVKVATEIKMSSVNAEYSKKFKFLDLQDQSKENIGLESLRAVMDYYSDDVDQHLVKEGIRCKTYLKETELEF